jgi:hypothetical protein
MLLPFWVDMLVTQVAEPERFAPALDVSVGLATLVTFHWPLVGAEFSDFAYLLSAGGLSYTVLPIAGAPWLLTKSWRALLAGSVRPDVEGRRSRLRREHRDDWRLDA